VSNDAATSVEKQCYRWSDSGFACKVYFYLSKEEGAHPARIRWLAFNAKTTHAIELDFVLQSTNNEELKLIDSVIDSISLNPLEKSTQSCTSVTQWY